MTANHAHTPTWDRVREHYYLGRQQFDDPLFPAGGVTEIVAEFDRWYQAEIAAAEQRGEKRAMKSLRPFVARVADHQALIGTETGREAKLLVHEFDRADQEGDDG